MKNGCQGPQLGGCTSFTVSEKSFCEFVNTLASSKASNSTVETFKWSRDGVCRTEQRSRLKYSEQDTRVEKIVVEKPWALSFMVKVIIWQGGALLAELLLLLLLLCE